MATTRAVLYVLLGGVLVLIPELFLDLLVVTPGTDRERHRRIVIVTAPMAAALHVRYASPGLLTIGSVLLAYSVAALAHASRAATRSAVGIALLCSILLLWGVVSRADTHPPQMRQVPQMRSFANGSCRSHMVIDSSSRAMRMAIKLQQFGATQYEPSAVTCWRQGGKPAETGTGTKG